MKKSKKPLKLSFFGSHPYPIEIWYAHDKRAWDARMKLMGLDEPYPGSAGKCTTFTQRGKTAQCIVTLSWECEGRNAVEVMGLMVHELVHVKQTIEQEIYQTNDGGGTTRLDIETEAYLLHALVMWLTEAFAKWGGKCKA